MILKKDQYVVNSKMEEWGTGKVIENLSGTTYSVFFKNVGYKKFNRKNNPLVETTVDIDDEIFNNLMNEKDSDFINKTQLKEHFLENYTDGFVGKIYKERERNYKDNAHALAIELLGQTIFIKLLDDEQYDEIFIRAFKIINKTNLIHHIEGAKFKDRFQTNEIKKDFAERLYDLLYKENSEQRNFEIWILFLKSIDSDKWTIASYFQFIFHPDKYMFIKPTITQEIASIITYDIQYTSTLNWNTYKKIQNFADYLKHNIASLNPKDMIDVQSYMWCVSDRNKG